MNLIEIKARLFEINRRMEAVVPQVMKAAADLREAVLAESVVTAPAFAALNAGLLLDRAQLLCDAGLAAREEMRRLSDEKRRLTDLLETLGGNDA